MFRRTRSLAVPAVAAVVLTGWAGALSAHAAPAKASARPHVQAAQATVVNAKPAKYTPDATDGTVYAIGQSGSTVVMGGSFTSVSDHGSTTAYPLKYIAAFAEGTGIVNQAFAPVLNNQVSTIIAGPTPSTVYVGGSFTTVNGVKQRVALLNLSDGSIVSGWKAPPINSAVSKLVVSGGRLWVAGSFTQVNGIEHDGLVALNPTTGALLPFGTPNFTGHHNYTGQAGQSNGAVGIKAFDINPAGTELIAIGNFTNVSGDARDQVARLTIGATAAAVDESWATLAYTATCFNWAFDSYVRDVQYSPDGSYFAIVATGGSGTNRDGTNSSCDTAARYDDGATGTNVRPAWIDYTGQDTLWSVAVSGSAVYVGGHERWMNNSKGYDRAGAGAVPRPGIAALDPVSGVPLAWNPGRNPRGHGAYALLLTPLGLYVGSDTDYVGDFYYHHKKIAFFPLAGGLPVTPDTTGQLPGNVYLLGNSAAPTSARKLHWDGSSAPSGAATISGFDTSSVRGAFLVNGVLYYGQTDGNLYQRSFDGRTFGAATLVDPYDDPTWSNIDTGSGQKYRGAKSGLYAQLPSVTAMFYSKGRVYYTLSGQSAMHWRGFSNDSGIAGSDEFTTTDGIDFSHVAGAFLSGGTLYFANSSDHKLYSVPFSNGQASGTPAVADSSQDWASKGAFLISQGGVNDAAPTAAFTSDCSAGTTCTVNGSGSNDSDGSIVDYTWNWGDGTSSAHAAASTSHAYSSAGSYPVTLTVTDDDGVTGTVSHVVRAGVAAPPAVAFRDAAATDVFASSASVTVPTTVATGDTMLLFESYASTTVTATTPAGWTAVGTPTTTSNFTTAVFSKIADASSAGSSVGVTYSGTVKSSLTLAAYSGTSASPIEVAAHATGTGSTAHVTPTVSGLTDGSLAVSFWADKSTGTTSWTAPGSVTQRSVVYGTGAGATSALVADSGSAVSGSYGGLTATTNVASGSAAQWTIGLSQAAG